MEEHGIEPKEKVSASRKLGEAEARQLIREARTIYVARGKKLEKFAGGKVSADLVEKMLGSTGNLRAPTLKVGKDVLVGFNPEMFAEKLG